MIYISRFLYLWGKWRQQLFSCDTPQVGSNAVIWCLWANGNIAWHASSKLSVPHSLVGWILNYRMAKWPCSHLSSLSGFIAVLCRECLPLCRQLPAGVWTNRDRARTLRKEERVERTGKDWEGAQLLIVAERLNGKEKVGWFLWGTQRWNAVQCGCQG